MRTKIGSLLFFIFTGCMAQAQVAINTTGANPDNSAMLDVSSTIKGLLVPRMTTAERTAIASPATGLLVYDNTLSLFYYYDGAAWTSLSTSGSAWSTTGNSGTVLGTHFIGTTDNQHLDFRTNNILHTRIRTTGQIEVFNTGGSTYLGQGAGANDDLNNHNNTAFGFAALSDNTASNNTAAGYAALGYNTTGSWNVSFGSLALLYNSTGTYNTAIGGQAMRGNTTGERNTAIGWNSLVNNSTGAYNVAVGQETLNSNTTGNGNIAIGYGTNVTSGNLTNATAIGYLANVSQSNSMVLGGTGANAINIGVGTTAPDNSALLDLTSTSKGVLVPRMTTAQRTAITSPATGLMVYDTDLSLFYYYNSTVWTAISTASSGWSLSGNSGTVSGTNFIGTTDNQNLDIRTNNTIHTRIRTNGQIEVLNTGRSTYLGENAGINDDLSTRRNVGIGYNALSTNTTAVGNTAVGYIALQSTTANSNTAVGYQTMAGNTTGTWNTALGQSALLSGSGNTGSYNTALGGQSLASNSTGSDNVSIGMNTMVSSSTGTSNVAIGGSGLNNNTTGNYNVAIGGVALSANTTGSNNIAIGYGANVTVGNLTNATAIGYAASVSQSNSMILGGTGANAVSVGIGTTAPVSTLDVVGSVGMQVKSSPVAGSNDPDATASIWIYNSGAGNITLPTASTCTNRMYVIVNKTGATVNISSYNDLTNTAQTTLTTATSITIVSDGTSWQQIR